MKPFIDIEIVFIKAGHDNVHFDWDPKLPIPYAGDHVEFMGYEGIVGWVKHTPFHNQVRILCNTTSSAPIGIAQRFIEAKFGPEMRMFASGYEPNHHGEGRQIEHELLKVLEEFEQLVRAKNPVEHKSLDGKRHGVFADGKYIGEYDLSIFGDH